MDRIHRLKWEINRLLIKEEKLWKQRSRTLWLCEGDQNTRFFDSHDSHRFLGNQIVELEDSASVVCSGEDEITNIFVNYYQSLFTSEKPTNLEKALLVVPELITEETNSLLTTEYVKAKVNETLNQMEPLKAPSPDGLPPMFFQKIWPCIGEDVSRTWYTSSNYTIKTWSFSRVWHGSSVIEGIKRDLTNCVSL